MGTCPRCKKAIRRNGNHHRRRLRLKNKYGGFRRVRTVWVHAKCPED